MTPQDIPVQGRRATMILVVAALVIAVPAIPGASMNLTQPLIALAFAVFIAIGEFARVALPGDREIAPLGAAAALGYALLPAFGGETVNTTPYQVVAVTTVATMFGVLPHVFVGRPPRLDAIARQIIVVGTVASLFRSATSREALSDFESWQLAIVLIGFALVGGLLHVTLAAYVRAAETRSPYRRVFLDELRSQSSIGSAVGATGVLIALSSNIMAFWALPVFCVPLFLTQYSFRRYAMIRATYRQTIRSLARVTDVGGYTTDGHARRVCELSLSVGRELGLSEAELLDLEYAALMHDIGQLSLVDPIPRGATALASPGDQRLLAEKGAEVIRETGVLDRVAEIVARQAEPYRRPGEAMDPTLPLASRIVRVANAYDDLGGGAGESGPRLSALEHLRLAMAYDYDPRVVETLSRIVERSAPVGV